MVRLCLNKTDSLIWNSVGVVTLSASLRPKHGLYQLSDAPAWQRPSKAKPASEWELLPLPWLSGQVSVSQLSAAPCGFKDLEVIFLPRRGISKVDVLLDLNGERCP